MSNVLWVFCFIISLIISNVCYAVVEVPCSPKGSHEAMRHTVENIDDSQLDVTFDGISADGYTQGLITERYVKVPYSVRKTMSKVDQEILRSIMFGVNARCSGASGIAIEGMNPGSTISCGEGESVLLELYMPYCSAANPDPVNHPDKRAVFTVRANKKKPAPKAIEVVTEGQVNETIHTSFVMPLSGVNAGSPGMGLLVQDGTY